MKIATPTRENNGFKSTIPTEEKMRRPKDIGNAYGFYWHAAFFAFAKNFMNVNTIIPAVLLSVGGTEVHLGFLTAIMLGGSRLTQIFFGDFLSNRTKKKPYLLFGINVRVLSLVALALVLQQLHVFTQDMVIILIFALISVFSLSGAFAGIAYIDLLGKSIQPEKRKQFFVTKQTITSLGILFSAIVVRKFMSLYPFPVNYSVIFYAAGGLLLIASGGFWILREKTTNSGQKTQHIFGKGANLLTILRNDPNFFSYLLLNNIVSIAIAIIPFYIALAKIRFQLTPRDVGNYLLFQILGMILSNVLWMKIIKKTNTYKPILYLYLLLGIFLPGYALVVSGSQTLYLSIFFFSGFALTAYEVVMSGILVEISTDENRALYTGISGTGNILSAIFPMIGGIFIAKIGYTIVFLCASLFICFGFVFAKRIHCQPEHSSVQ